MSKTKESGASSQGSHSAARGAAGRHTHKGTLIIIGGSERRDEKGMVILEEVAAHVKRKHETHLLLVTAATYEPEGVAEEYIPLFKKLGVPKIEVMDIRNREQAYLDANVKKVEKSSVIYFTGGDQLRITSQMSDTPVYRCMQEIYDAGGVIAGTSAGAAAMPETMLVSGEGDMTPRSIHDLGMAPGLGLIADMVIDTHFSERGRIGRLLGVVAQNPRNLGVGIDEATAIVVKGGREFEVLGAGGVYVLDATRLTYSSLSERSRGVMSIHNVVLHLLSEGDHFDLANRGPIGINDKAETLVKPESLKADVAKAEEK
jgi:cyanophycinase